MHRSFILIPGFLLISTIALGFNQPTDVALDRKGNIYVADGYGNSRVLKFDKYGNPLMGWGMKGTGPGQFDLPHTIVIDGDMVYVGDRENARILIFDTSGRYLREWRLGHPFRLVITLDHSIYMADAIAGCILKTITMARSSAYFAGQNRTGDRISIPTKSPSTKTAPSSRPRSLARAQKFLFRFPRE